MKRDIGQSYRRVKESENPAWTELQEKMSRDKYNQIVFEEGKGIALYLVGGFLRDILLNRNCVDRDFVVSGDYRSFLERLAKKMGGRLFRLGDALDRIVLSDASTLDFTQLKGNIASDLRRRDFTINSMAWSPATGFIDPQRGMTDLQRRAIRTVSPRNLRNDPIRLIRAYRLASQLSFRIDPDTVGIIRKLAPRVADAKRERITLEFFNILNLDTVAKSIHGMFADGLLVNLIPLTDNELRRKLRVLSRLERIFNVLPLKYTCMLNGIYSQSLSLKGVIRLEVLLKGQCATERFSFSRKIAKSLKKINDAEKLLHASRWTCQTLFPVFSLLGEKAFDLILIKGKPELLSEYERYQAIMRRGLLSTEEIIRESGLQEGMMLGKVIMALRRAEFEKKVNRKDQARDYIRMLQNPT